MLRFLWASMRSEHKQTATNFPQHAKDASSSFAEWQRKRCAHRWVFRSLIVHQLNTPVHLIRISQNFAKTLVFSRWWHRVIQKKVFCKQNLQEGRSFLLKAAVLVWKVRHILCEFFNIVGDVSTFFAFLSNSIHSCFRYRVESFSKYLCKKALQNWHKS